MADVTRTRKTTKNKRARPRRTATVDTVDGPVRFQYVGGKLVVSELLSPEAQQQVVKRFWQLDRTKKGLVPQFVVAKDVATKTRAIPGRTKATKKKKKKLAETGEKAATAAAEAVEAPHADDLEQMRHDLVARLSPSVATLDPVPGAMVEQARRLALWRAELMERGALDLDAFANGWVVSADAARKRIQRHEDRRALFTVTYGGRSWVPAFLLDEHLEPRPELAGPIAALRDGGDSGFSLWTWLVTPSTWLDGRIPEQFAREDPDAVTAAAARAIAA